MDANFKISKASNEQLIRNNYESILPKVPNTDRLQTKSEMTSYRDKMFT